MKILIFAIAIFIAVPVLGIAKNLHLIEKDKVSGFFIYRSGKPERDDVREYCKLGIEEVMVLSGNADEHEFKFKEDCPTLKVVYNEKQSSKIPMTKDFLRQFDMWVQDAQINGKKIAIRCNCGCHRTGRLAAYYQMKYQKLTSVDAIVIMKKHGERMFFFPHLNDQVREIEKDLL
jgi:hypothetical protein